MIKKVYFYQSKLKKVNNYFVEYVTSFFPNDIILRRQSEKCDQIQTFCNAQHTSLIILLLQHH